MHKYINTGHLKSAMDFDLRHTSHILIKTYLFSHSRRILHLFHANNGPIDAKVRVVRITGT